MDHDKVRLRVQNHLMEIRAMPPRPSESTLRNLLPVLGELSEPIELPQFPSVAMNVTNRLFASDICCYVEVDTETMQTSVVFDCPPAQAGEVVDTWTRLAFTEPLLSYWKWFQPGFVVTLSDFGPQARIRDLDFYEQCLRPIGIEHHLFAPFIRHSNRILSIGYGRERQDFSEDDRLALMLLWPQLALCRRHCEFLSIARAGEPIVHEDLSVTQVEIVVLGRDGRIRSTSRRAVELIRRYIGEFPRYSARLPPRLEAEIFNDSALDFPELEAFTMTEGGEISLYLCHREALTIETLVDAIGTTRRRAEISRFLCRGATHEGIAEELHIAIGTVHKHVEHLYAALDVCRRVEAVDEIHRRVVDFLRRRRGS